MSRSTGPIEFTQVLVFLSIEPLPLSVDIGGFFWLRETYNPNSPVYTALALDELVESVSGSVGISLDAEAASAITVWLNSVPIGDVEPGETLDLSFFDVPVSVHVTPFVDLFDLRVTRIGEFTGELLGECPFTLNSLTVDFTVAGGEEPVGECFWTDLVGVTQECSEAPDPEVSWIPIHTSGAYYSLLAHSEGTSMVDSTITTDIAFGDPGWRLWLGTPEPPGGRVRVTVSITSATAGENSLLVFQYTNGGGGVDTVLNEHPDSTAFEPSQFVVEIANNGELYYLELAAFDTTGLTATYLIEVEGSPL